MNTNDLAETAHTLDAGDKGLLALDESDSTRKKAPYALK